VPAMLRSTANAFLGKKEKKSKTNKQKNRNKLVRNKSIEEKCEGLVLARGDRVTDLRITSSK